MKNFRILIGLIISAAFLFLVFREIDFEKALAAIGQINPWPVPLAILVYFGGVWVRTVRWGILMRPIKACSTRELFPIYVISYMANNILPLRIGDIYRAYIVGKKQRISKSGSLVTIAVERIFDGLTMLILLVIGLMLYPVNDPVVKKAINLGSIVFLSAIFVCYIMILNRRMAQWLFSKFVHMAPARLHPKMEQLFDNLFKGLDSLKGIRIIISIIALSLGTWLIEALSYYITLRAFSSEASVHVSIAAMAMVNLMIIVPSAPGYFGPFEAACLIILGKTGYGNVMSFTPAMAAAYALVLHVIVQWIPSTLLGLFYMWKEHITFKEIDKDGTEETNPAGTNP